MTLAELRALLAATGKPWSEMCQLLTTSEEENQDLKRALGEALDAWSDFAASYLNSHSDAATEAASRIAELRKLLKAAP